MAGRSESEQSQSETSSQHECDEDELLGAGSPDEMAAFEQRAHGSSSPLQRGGGGVDAGSSAHKGSSRKEKEKERDKSKSVHPDQMDLNQLLSAGEGILQISIIEGSLLCSHSSLHSLRLALALTYTRTYNVLDLYSQYYRLIVEES